MNRSSWPRVWPRAASLALLALTLLVPSASPALAGAGDRPEHEVSTAGSVPIELDEAAALPAPGEVVGGFHGVFIALAIVVVVAIIVIIVLEMSHVHMLFGSCEECRHHHHHEPPHKPLPGDDPYDHDDYGNP